MLTPLDIESKTFKKGMGYNSKEVDRFLRDILSDYEKIYKENIELKDKVNVLNEGIQYYKTMEDTLQNTLVLAEKTAEEAKSNARKKAEQIEKDAEIKARTIVQDARTDLYSINNKIEELIEQYESYKIQIKQYLKTQLELIESKELPIVNTEEKKEIKEFVKSVAKKDESEIIETSKE